MSVPRREPFIGGSKQPAATSPSTTTVGTPPSSNFPKMGSARSLPNSSSPATKPSPTTPSEGIGFGRTRAGRAFADPVRPNQEGTPASNEEASSSGWQTSSTHSTKEEKKGITLGEKPISKISDPKKLSASGGAIAPSTTTSTRSSSLTEEGKKIQMEKLQALRTRKVFFPLILNQQDILTSLI